MFCCLNLVHIYSLVSHQALASLAGSGVAKGVEGVAGCAASHGNGHLVIAKILLCVWRCRAWFSCKLKEFVMFWVDVNHYTALMFEEKLELMESHRRELEVAECLSDDVKMSNGWSDCFMMLAGDEKNKLWRWTGQLWFGLELVCLQITVWLEEKVGVFVWAEMLYIIVPLVQAEVCPWCASELVELSLLVITSGDFLLCFLLQDIDLLQRRSAELESENAECHLTKQIVVQGCDFSHQIGL